MQVVFVKVAVVVDLWLPFLREEHTSLDHPCISSLDRDRGCSNDDARSWMYEVLLLLWMTGCRVRESLRKMVVG